MRKLPGYKKEKRTVMKKLILVILILSSSVYTQDYSKEIKIQAETDLK